MATMAKIITHHRIRQSLCRWCFETLPLETLAREAAAIGYVGIDLVEPRDWPVLQAHGLICTMTPSHTIVKGLNNPAYHAECLASIRESIDATAAAGFPNVICFSGNREDHIPDHTGITHTADALKQIAAYAEQKGVTVCIELLNSKVDHPAYMCDRSDWGAAVLRRVGSERVKLLFDIYHAQVQEGDIIASIKKNADIIGHYHTAGVPGRHELDDTQELNYPAIMRAILATGYTGYVAQEFIPTRDPLESLRQAAHICDV
jgi:hydroxypyruvate isomerase